MTDESLDLKFCIFMKSRVKIDNYLEDVWTF